jgi:esterase/lipase
MKTEDFNLSDSTHWRLYTPENAQDGWVVLWLQGFTSTIDAHDVGNTRMSRVNNIRFAVLNYAGHGDHPVNLQNATREQQFEAVCGVYDELEKLGLNKVIVIGCSIGAYMAALLAGVKKPRAVVLRAPANYKEEEFSLTYKETMESRDKEAKDLYRQSITSDYSNNAVEAVRRFEGDTYVIQHEKDSVINAAIPKSYYNAAKHGNYIVIRNCDHTPKMTKNPKVLYDIIERWIQTIIYVTINGPDEDD